LFSQGNRNTAVSRRPKLSLGLFALIPLGALALYIFTSYPGPGWIDSGELATVSHSLGIPHPTGSPLYVLISHLASLLGPGSFWPLTLLSSLAAAVAVCLLMLCLPIGNALYDTVAALATGLMVAAAPSLWDQAIINEVYALQALLLALFLYIRTRPESPRRMALSAFLAGLAFANHQSAIFLSPFLVADLWFHWRDKRAWAAVFGFGLLGSSLYLYLPIRSAQGPLWDWGGTHRLAAFWRHISGWQYKGWVGLHSWNELSSALRFASFHLSHNAAYAGLPLAALGLWSLWKKSRSGAVASGLGFLVCLAFGINFPNPDLESFYLLAYLLCA
jgi:hypothetical protein